jgi:hypothetical protein
MIGIPAGRTLIVKVGLDGQAYVDFRAVGREQLAADVATVTREGGSVTYYRESPETEGSDAAAETFAAIVALKPPIRLGGQVPSEWGRLDWVEVEQAPHLCRVFMARGQKFLISPPPTPTQPRPAVLMGGPMTPDQADHWLGQVDLLLRSDRVLEEPEHRPEVAMEEAAQAEPSLHLRIAYEKRRWASWYPLAELPSNLASFNLDLWRLAIRFKHAFNLGATQMSPGDAFHFFDEPAGP